VVGRALAFSDPAIVKMATDEFVPCVADDWYQRRRQDDEGKFWRKVVDQSWKAGGWDANGGQTRQGIYVFTAAGRLVWMKNTGGLVEHTRDELRGALAAFRRIPQSERAPGAVRVEDWDGVDRRFHREPPAKGLIIKTYTRALEKKDNKLCPSAGKVKIGDLELEPEAQRDHIWLTEAEWKALVPSSPQVGQRIAVPPAVRERIVRFSLVDSTTGEPPMWARDQIRTAEMHLTVESVTTHSVRLRLEGVALLSTQADRARADRGFDGRLFGYLNYNRATAAFDRFDVVAVGEHWGSQPAAAGGRDRQLIGIAFELSGKTPADRIAPQGARDLYDYFGR
jgi:hypothetical protein